jgi:2,5-diamino-6-(ribosylamino)-4(3H)-pyrimidinone 5'-phosphate reductase
MNEGRPFVILNAAMTADGKTDTVARQGAHISSERDWERVDRMRAECDAVMVGGHTLLGDDPKLTVKSPLLRAGRLARGLDENPIKVGVVSRIVDPAVGPSLHENSHFITAGPARRLLFTTEQTSPEQVARMADLGVELFVLGKSRVDLVAALHCLSQLGVKRLLVEGGATLNAELLRRNLIDEIYLYMAPLIFGGATAPTLVDGSGFDRQTAIRLSLLDLERMDDGALLFHYAIPEY